MSLVDPTLAYSLFDPEPVARVSAARWQALAARHLGAALVVYGAAPEDAAGPVSLSVRVEALTGEGRDFGTVRVVSVAAAEAQALVAHGNACAVAMGGAGMDALMARTRRVWQVERAPHDGTLRVAGLLVAATLCLDLLGPVAPPDERCLVGIKGLRVRLEALGWG